MRRGRRDGAPVFSELLPGRIASSDQIEFIDIAPSGPERVFDIDRAKKLVGVIKGLNESAAG